MTLLTRLNKGPTLSSLHVNQPIGADGPPLEWPEWDWEAVRGAILEEMERRGMEIVDKDDGLEGDGVEKGYEVPIVKYDDFKGLVYGVVLEPGSVDSQGDIISEEEIEKACHDFMRRGHRLDLQHHRDVQDDEAEVVENYIAPGDFEGVKKGSWVMVTQLKTDEFKKQAQEGEIAFYSIRGRGMRQSVELGVEKAETVEEVLTLLAQLNKASFTNDAWDKSVTNRLSAAEYCRCCLVDGNAPGEEKVKAKCKLPIRATPGGPIYRAALRNAASRISQMTEVSAEDRAKAARRLENLKQQAGVGEE